MPKAPWVLTHYGMPLHAGTRSLGFLVSEGVKTVLYVEDDPDDVFFLRRAMKARAVACELQVVSNVADAKRYLLGEGRYKDRSRFPKPAVLLTDSTIKTPEGSSLDLIAWIRSQGDMQELPILCVTGNNDPEVLRQFWKAGVECHFKTASMGETAKKVEAALADED